MNKRIYLILLIVGSALAIALVIFYFLWPFGSGGPKAPQPQPLPSEIPSQPFDPSRPPTLDTSDVPTPDINDPAERERQAQEALKRQGLDFSARQGSYSSADEFIAIRQIYPQSTSNLVAFLEDKRQSLIDKHPFYGASYGRTTRSLSAKILSGTPIVESKSAVVEVQTQVVTNDSNGSESISYERVTISYTKSGSTWLAERVETTPMDL